MHTHSLEDLEVVRVAMGRHVQLRDIPSPSFFAWCDAFCSAVALTWAFDSGGAVRAQYMLSSIRVRKTTVSTYPLDIRLFQARRAAMILKAMINLVLGPRLCFASSFALCAGLRRLGVACSIVVGYEQIYQYTQTPMDAYVEYEQEPISTNAEVKYSFVSVLTYGRGDGA